MQRTRDGGAEIVKYLKTGSAYYAPSAAATEMVEAILKDKKKILPCAAYLEGEYGINGLYVGVPCKLGSAGIEEIIQIKLTADEQAALQKSADSVKELGWRDWGLAIRFVRRGRDFGRVHSFGACFVGRQLPSYPNSAAFLNACSASAFMPFAI